MSTILEARAGWWHDYVCPTHGVELGPATDAGYPCRYGCVLDAESFAGAWVVLEHQARAREARLLARRHRAEGAPADRDRALAILEDFAAYYAEVALVGTSERAEEWMLKGKLFSQALTEAIWAVQIADAAVVLAALDDVRPVLADRVAPMLARLLDTVAGAWHRLVVERDEPASNYVAWLDAAGVGLSRALSAVGGSSGDPLAGQELWLDRSLSYLDLAVDEQGWEWEGSTYYHLFVLRAALLSLQGSDPASLPEKTQDRLAAMLSVLVRLAGPDGGLPALHDGPFDRIGVHLEVLEICALARQLWVHPPVDAVEGWVRDRLAGERDGLEDLLDGWFDGPALHWPVAGDLRASTHFAGTGYVVLHDYADTLTAILDAGPHGGSHGHLDKLGLYLYGEGVAWQPAPGVPPYGSHLRREYYARTRAHPTVRIDDQDQRTATGTVDVVELDRTADVDRVVAGSGEALDGVQATREVVRTPSYLLDVVRVRVTEPTAGPGTTERTMTLGLRPAVPLEVTALSGGWRTLWRGPLGRDLHGFHRATTASTLVASPGRGPSDDPAALWAIGDWTAWGTEACFVSVYCLGEARVADLELQTSGTGVTDDPNGQRDSGGTAELLAVRIHLTDGTTTEHMVAR